MSETKQLQLCYVAIVLLCPIILFHGYRIVTAGTGWLSAALTTFGLVCATVMVSRLRRATKGE